MSYVAKMDWKHDDPVTEQDLNRWETGIKENTEKLGTVQEFALTTASGDAKESITNVNTATTVGLFLVGSTATGAPTTAVGLLYVWRRGSTHLLQEFWEVSTNTRHHRTSLDNGATWQSWQTIANTDVATTSKNGLMSSSDKAALDNAQKVKLTLDNGTNKSMPASDANLVTETGFYVTSVGAQNTAVLYGTLLHINRGSTSKMQVQWSNGTGDTYVRSDSGTGWSTWKRLTDNNILGGILLGNKLVDTQTANFIGKVSGSTTVNPHIAKRASGTSPFTALATPPNTDLLEMTDAMYLQLSSLDASTYTLSFSSINGWMAQHLFSFNLIEHVQRTYGTIPGATTADKVAWLKENIKSFTANWHGYGSSPSGSKASFTVWHSGAWVTPTTHSSSFVNRLAIFTNTVNNVASRIGNDGFVHFLAYADPSNGVTSSVLNTDYVELQVELSTSLKDNNKPVWIDATLQNGWVVVTDSDQVPRYSIGSDGYVSLKGAIRLGTLPGICITLPSGYRPTKSTVIPVSGASGNIYRITISTGGSVTVEQSIGSGGNALVYLDGIRFPTN